jgi:hypothetical protein
MGCRRVDLAAESYRIVFCDVAKGEDVQEAVATAIREFGGIALDLHAAGRRQFGHQPVRVLSREPFTRLSARGLWLRRPVRAHELVRDPY